MPLSAATLNAMQKAGAAVYQADHHLKEAVKEHAQRISAALKASPLDAENDALFEDWKAIARLSQTISDIEAQLSKAFAAAGKLKGGKGRGAGKAAAKAAAKAARKGAKARKPADPSAPKGKRGRKRSADGMAGNPAKLLQHLQTLLNTSDFTVISQSEAGRQTGIPIGSMTAALKRLTELGRISVGANGGYKLAAA